MIKVYLEPDEFSRGIQRVSTALVRYMPDRFELVFNEKQADLVIIHVTGRRDSIINRVERLEKVGKKYAMIQYVLKSSQKPSSLSWINLWNNAELVWSYYDLPEIYYEDCKNIFGETAIKKDFPSFYYAPLGVNIDVFFDRHYKNRDFIIGASSQHALSESVRECAFATKNIGKKMFFLGHELRRGDDIVCKGNLTDKEVAEYWSRCHFVSGLRRIEGFEFPVIEGLACGAIPIVFDRPEMRYWFGDLAVFIGENDRNKVIKDLTTVFSIDYPTYSSWIKATLHDRFNWEKIIKNFWKKL